MDNPSARLLRLLTLLQSRVSWTGAELTDRLGTSARTLRYDVVKLRDLGYAVHAAPGTAGGYALQAGAAMPPLQLDDEEAVALAVGLRLAAGAGLVEAAATALVKLEQVLPRRLRGRVDALRAFTVSLPTPGPRTDPGLLVFLTGACRDHRRVRFDYADRDGAASRREVEPYRLALMGGHWYLLAFDPDRDDWRTFRLDRFRLRRPEGARFAPREAPDPYRLLAATDAFHRRHRAVAVVAAPAEEVSRRLPAEVVVEPVDDGACRVHASGGSAPALALNLVLLDRDLTLEQASPDVLDALRVIGQRISHALRDR